MVLVGCHILKSFLDRTAPPEIAIAAQLDNIFLLFEPDRCAIRRTIIDHHNAKLGGIVLGAQGCHHPLGVVQSIEHGYQDKNGHELVATFLFCKNQPM